jgi:site-specific recombinase XerD
MLPDDAAASPPSDPTVAHVAPIVDLVHPIARRATAPAEPGAGNDAGDAAAVRAFGEALHLSPALAERLVTYQRRARTARAANTLRAMQADLTVWNRWCTTQRHLPLPATPAAVAAFVEAHAPSRAPATLRRYLASIGALHRAARLADPTKDEDVRLALAGATRRLATEQTAGPAAGQAVGQAVGQAPGQGARRRQAAGLTERAVGHILAATLATMPDDRTDGIPDGLQHGVPDRLIDRRDVALLLTARDLLARRSELVALRVEDLTPAADGGATILIRRSKTDQIGEGAVAYLGPATYRALRAWLDAAGVAEGPVFRSVHRSGRVGAALHAQKVAAILKKLAARAAPELRRLGLDPAGVSGHSCRVGMAQDLVEAGLELPAIMQAGRWKTPEMVARYAERLLATRGAVAQYHARRGRTR